MSRLILHRAIGSPPARAVMMLGDILSIKFEIRDINIIKMEHKSPAFLKLNPMGTVPVLQDGDFVLSESNAIMKYILSKYGGDHKERLYPSDLQTRAIIDQCMFFNAGVFFIALRNVGLETLLSGLAEPSGRHRAQIDASYRVVEAYLARTRYIAADSLTLADLSVGTTATAIQCMHPLDNNLFPKCADWMARLEEETFFKTINREGADFFGKMFNALWKKNKMKN